MQVPVLDLGGLGRPRGAEQAVGACLEHSGFLLLEGHGLDPALWREATAAAREFFALPTEMRRRYHRPEGAGQRGYTPFAVEVAKGAREPDPKEFFQLGREDAAPALGGGANLWPQEVPGFRRALTELFQGLDALAQDLLRGIALHLDLPVDWFTDRSRRGDTILRALHYPPLPDGAGLRAAPHGDINLITVLATDGEPGLEVRGRDGRWWPVTPDPGRLVCNVGDMLARLTAGRLPSTWHRVVRPPAPWSRRSRYSLPFFFHADPDLRLAPVPSCAGRAPLGPPVTAREYLAERLAEIGLAPPPGGPLG